MDILTERHGLKAIRICVLKSAGQVVRQLSTSLAMLDVPAPPLYRLTGRQLPDRSRLFDRMTTNCQSDSPAPPKLKICDACGAQFPCHSPWGPCWCEKVQLTNSTLADLRARYADCLCPACLAKAAASQAAPAKPAQS